MAPRARLTCPACGGGLRPWRDVPGGEPADFAEYELLRCAACGSAVTSGNAPRPEVYESGQYAIAEPRGARVIERVLGVVARQPVALLRRAGLRRGARVLDVGAGRGRLVEAFAKAGYEARGIDPSARAIALARRAGRPVERRSLMDHVDTGLDAVVLWHVLEHLEDPAAALAIARGWLRSDGLLLVGVPNAASLQASIGGDGWFHWDAPRHRMHFTPAGLNSLLDRTGFEDPRTHHWILDQSVQSMWMAMLFQLGAQPGFPFHFLKRTIRPTALDVAVTTLGIPLLPVAAGLEGMAALGRRGGTIAVVARAL